MGNRWSSRRRRMARPAVCYTTPPPTCTDSSGLPIFQYTVNGWVLRNACACTDTPTPPPAPGAHFGDYGFGSCLIRLTCADTGGLPIYSAQEDWLLTDACSCVGTPTPPGFICPQDGNDYPGTCTPIGMNFGPCTGVATTIRCFVDRGSGGSFNVTYNPGTHHFTGNGSVDGDTWYADLWYDAGLLVFRSNLSTGMNTGFDVNPDSYACGPLAVYFTPAGFSPPMFFPPAHYAFHDDL